jgi:hypothetical protein
VGPAAIVNAHRFIFDSRDEAGDERLEILADKDGVWRCRTIFNCVGRLPARDQDHPGDPRGQLGHRGAAGLSEASALAPAGGRRPAALRGTRLRHPDRRCRAGQPGPASLGAALIDSLAGRPQTHGAPDASISEYLGHQTNNVAEYTGVVRALELAREPRGAARCTSCSTPSSSWSSWHGRWRVKDAKLHPALGRLDGVLAWLPSVVRGPRPAGPERVADALANEAIDRVAGRGSRSASADLPGPDRRSDRRPRRTDAGAGPFAPGAVESGVSEAVGWSRDTDGVTRTVREESPSSAAQGSG